MSRVLHVLLLLSDIYATCVSLFMSPISYLRSTLYFLDNKLDDNFDA